MRTHRSTTSQLLAASGRGLAAVFFVVGRLRRGRAKALHPRGTVLTGRLERLGGFSTGVDWVDDAGSDLVTVRLSRSAGLPPPLPDVLGLAIRVALPDSEHGDLLLSTTGRRGVSRFVLRPAVRPWQAFYSSLLPYRTPTGPLLIGAEPAPHAGTDAHHGVRLLWSRPTGAWRAFGLLELLPAPARGPDAELSFDPVLHEVPGLHTYGWVRRLRQPSYAAARRARQPA